MTVTSSGKITVSTTKSASGTITIQDGATKLATIPASGTVTETATTISNVGSADGWTLTVTWNANNTASGSAAGNYGGSNLNVPVAVQVDHGGPN